MRGKGASSTSIGFLEHKRIIPSTMRSGDLVLVQERGLEVDLGEFGLAVGAQVLVAEALGTIW